jgi:hypothetical protein
MGVGRIVNEIRADRGYRIYEDQNYNRYTYLGRQRLDRDVIMQSSVHARVLETLERMLFYGSRHAKRGHGIHELPVRIRKNRPGFSFTHFFTELFGEPTGEPMFSAVAFGSAPLLSGEPRFSAVVALSAFGSAPLS